MKRLFSMVLLAAGCLTLAAGSTTEKAGSERPRNYSEWLTRSEMKREPRSYMLDYSWRPNWGYVMGIELESMLDTYLRYGGDDIRDYCLLYTDTMIAPDGTIKHYKLDAYNLDNVRTGHFVNRMNQNFPEQRYIKAMNTLMRQLNDQPRTNEGVYWHKAIYSYQVWLDGIFMGLPFRVLTASQIYTPELAKPIYDDAVDQVKSTYDRT
ncbi:MAG: glycoside hydrolase family 88 protein, partial [Duncaniella sp.]|nr:glycoside hydrolase family 88 protein [Duncaniella sp.]